MIKHFYEMVFNVTRTSDNGNERTFNTSVYCIPFKRVNGRVIHRTEEERIKACIAELERTNHRNIKYVKTHDRWIKFA